MITILGQSQGHSSAPKKAVYCLCSTSDKLISLPDPYSLLKTHVAPAVVKTLHVFVCFFSKWSVTCNMST